MSFHNFLMWKLSLHWTELSCSYCNLPRVNYGKCLDYLGKFCTLRASWKQYGMGAVKSIFRTEKTTQFVGNPDGFKNVTDQLQWWIIHTFTSKFSLGYFIVICPLVVSYSDTLQFHSCTALCCIWTNPVVHVLSAVAEVCWLHHTFLVQQGCAARFGLCVTKHSAISVLALCWLKTC